MSPPSPPSAGLRFEVKYVGAVSDGGFCLAVTCGFGVVATRISRVENRAFVGPDGEVPCMRGCGWTGVVFADAAGKMPTQYHRRPRCDALAG